MRLRTLTSVTKNFFHQLFNHSNNPHVVGRDHRHLRDQYRRRILSPDAAHKHLYQLLVRDPHFTELFDFRHPTYIVRACLVGEELRANIHELARFPCGLMTPAYHASWRKDDIVNFFVVDDEGVPRVHLISQEGDVDATLTYDVYEPRYSYARILTKAEIQQIDCYSRPHWSTLA